MKLHSVDIDDAAVEWLKDNGFDIAFDSERAEIIVWLSKRDPEDIQVLKAMAVMAALAPSAWELKEGRLRLMWE